MKIYFKNNRKLRRIFYFFPVQLFFATLKKNYSFVLLWLLFFGFITRALAAGYGVPYLFLYPEYLNNVNFLSYFILGYSCGGFIMAFNISSYIVNSFRFPFLATLERPFFTFFLNNFIIPGLFVITFISSVVYFRSIDNDSGITITFHLLGFLLGIIMFMLIVVCYFFIFEEGGLRHYSNRKNKKFVVIDYLKHSKNIPKTVSEITMHVPLAITDRTWHVETYLAKGFKLRLTRGFEHYHHTMLEKIFRKNHKTGFIFEVISVTTLLTLGLFRDKPVFMIPAGASIFLLFTVFIHLLSALNNWFRGWAFPVFILLVLFLNSSLKLKLPFFSGKAYGIDYSGIGIPYTYLNIEHLSNDTTIKHIDKANTEAILERWKKKNTTDSNSRIPPVMVIINSSGGGLRSAMWTFYTLQYMDSILHGGLFNYTEFITGSSGGMIGASYYRELYLKKLTGQIHNPDDRIYYRKISADMLNPVAFTIATNDLAFRLLTFRDGSYTYTKDRGFAFEEKLDENTDSVMMKRLGEYKEPELKAQIPMMLITATIENDGRMMLISPLGISYMTGYDNDTNLSYEPLAQSVEFSKLFASKNAENLFFTSALRMSSTFPYVTPAVTLPSSPLIDVMDAGQLDNFGTEETVKFIYSFRKWLETNTSRIVLIQIRDQYKQQTIGNNAPKSILEGLINPVNRFYKNLFPIQNYKGDRLLEYMSRWYKGKINVINFQLNNQGNDDISLSWHLTNFEKSKVEESMKEKDNANSLSELKELIK